jgi:hypothetical protein
MSLTAIPMGRLSEGRLTARYDDFDNPVDSE